jgi:hypothetical protein
MIRSLATLTLLSALTFPALADPDGIEATVTVNPVDLVNGVVNFEIEGALAERVSMYGGVTFLVWEGVFNERDGDGYFAAGPELGLRLFLLGDAPIGLWVGPYAGLAYVTVEDGGASADALGIYAGGMAGVTVALLDAIAISGGIGAGYHDLSARLGDEYYGVRGPIPRFRLAIGAAF